MKARPILFSAPMVRALLDGGKTQTRRLMKPQPALKDGFWELYGAAWSEGIRSVHAVPGHSLSTRNPYGQPGDLLWARECFSYGHAVNDDPERRHLLSPWYWADGNPEYGDFAKPRPSIHMPRWASRLTLEITRVRVERLQDISEADSLAEGIKGTEFWRDEHPPSICYSVLWNTINGPSSWDADPWVWVLEFRVHRQNVDVLLKIREDA